MPSTRWPTRITEHSTNCTTLFKNNRNENGYGSTRCSGPQVASAIHPPTMTSVTYRAGIEPTPRVTAAAMAALSPTCSSALVTGRCGSTAALPVVLTRPPGSLPIAIGQAARREARHHMPRGGVYFAARVPAPGRVRRRCPRPRPGPPVTSSPRRFPDPIPSASWGGLDPSKSCRGLARALAQEHAQGVGVLIADFPRDGFQGQAGRPHQVDCLFDPQILHEADGRGTQGALDGALEGSPADADGLGGIRDADGLGQADRKSVV